MTVEALLEQTRNIYAIGRNYAEHIAELGNEPAAEPVVFAKSLSSLTTADHLNLPAGLRPIHHELELVLRIGAPLALGAFSGLTCVSHLGLGIDFTARNTQTALKSRGLPWELAKSFQHACFLAGFAPATRLDEPRRFALYRNERLVQEGDSRLMIFSFEAILAFLNRTLPLAPGDLIFTGTPAGVGPVDTGDSLRIISENPAIERQITIEYV